MVYSALEIALLPSPNSPLSIANSNLNSDGSSVHRANSFTDTSRPGNVQKPRTSSHEDLIGRAHVLANGPVGVTQSMTGVGTNTKSQHGLSLNEKKGLIGGGSGGVVGTDYLKRDEDTRPSLEGPLDPLVTVSR